MVRALSIHELSDNTRQMNSGNAIMFSHVLTVHPENQHGLEGKVILIVRRR